MLYGVPVDRPGRAAGAARQGCNLRRAWQSWTAESASDDAATQSICIDCCLCSDDMMCEKLYGVEYS